MTRSRGAAPLAAFAAAALVGWIGAAVLWSAAGRAERLVFASVADEATNRIRERVRLHLSLIEATAAMVEATAEDLTAGRFARYFAVLDLDERNRGIAGLGYAPLTTTEALPEIVRRLHGGQAGDFTLWPETGAERVAPVLLLGSPDPDPPRAIGFDMYSEPRRRAAMVAAVADGAPRATEPLNLATDREARPGFIVYAPIYGATLDPATPAARPAAPIGFVFGGFRADDLVAAAMEAPPRPPVVLTIADADTPDAPLHVGGIPPGRARIGSIETRRSLEVAGQDWTLDFRPGADFEASAGRGVAVAFAAIATALAVAVAMAQRDQARARQAAEALAAETRRNLAEKDLLLQEMRHRIKNAIARILAIARQTAAAAADLPAFSAAFTRRLQAMAEAQDLMARSATGGADLAELLRRELGQVFGEGESAARIAGPEVALDATETQALGLVFHELATNALKYGGGGAGPEIEVRWRLAPEDGRRGLALEWRETGGAGIAAPQTTGFGAKLIEASLRVELGGRIARDWRPEGLRLALWMPLRSAGRRA